MYILSFSTSDYCFNIWHNDTECNYWAEIGECDRNPTWMARRCHKACNYCYHDCRDKYIPEKCMQWANMGECDANPKWMHPNCAQSCGICFGGKFRNKLKIRHEWSIAYTKNILNNCLCLSCLTF